MYAVEEKTQYDDANEIESILPEAEEVQAHQTLIYYDLVGFKHLTELLDPYQCKRQYYHDQKAAKNVQNAEVEVSSLKLVIIPDLEQADQTD